MCGAVGFHCAAAAQCSNTADALLRAGADHRGSIGAAGCVVLLLSGFGFIILALGGALEAQSVFASRRKKSPAEPKSAAVVGT